MRGWESVPLGEVARIERKVIEPGAIDQESTYVGLEHIGSDGSFLGPSRVGSRQIESAKFAFSRRHLLYGKLRPYLAKIACPEFDGICSTDILPVLPGPRINRRFLCHFLRLPDVVERAAMLSVGANLPRLSPSVLETFPIPLPPWSEQRRIAEILDRAEALRAKRRAAPAEADALTQAIFLEMFGDPTRTSKKYPQTRLAQLGTWRSGGTPPRAETDYFEGTIPWFSSGELGDRVIVESIERISSRALKETSAKPVPKGSLMLGMYDTAALKASIAGVDGSCNQAIAFSELASGLVTPTYAYFAISIGRDHFRRLQRGVRQKNLNLAMVREIGIPLPPLSLQHAFARRAAAVEKLKAAHRASLAQLDALFASLQHRAFRGEL